MKKKEHLLDQIEERLKFLHELGVDSLSKDWLGSVKGIRKSRLHGEKNQRAPEKSEAEEQEKIERAEKGKASFQSLIDLRNDIGDCTRCKLHMGRTHIVFGAGNPQADLIFIGEAPGVDEDIQGLPFVGRAGQLLTRIIKAIDMEREDVYIANIIKCRPPQNRSPQPDEIETCVPFLFRQIEIIQPKIIIALGSFAAQRILNTKLPITSLRGRFMKFKDIRVMPTFHPAYLLRNMNKKREVWEDMKLVRDELKNL
jgi:DNA polymerase